MMKIEGVTVSLPANRGFSLFFVDWRYERYEQNIDIAEFDGVSLSLIWKICLIEKS